MPTPTNVIPPPMLLSFEKLFVNFLSSSKVNTLAPSNSEPASLIQKWLRWQNYTDPTIVLQRYSSIEKNKVAEVGREPQLVGCLLIYKQLVWQTKWSGVC